MICLAMKFIVNPTIPVTTNDPVNLLSAMTCEEDANKLHSALPTRTTSQLELGLDYIQHTSIEIYVQCSNNL